MNTTYKYVAIALAVSLGWGISWCGAKEVKEDDDEHEKIEHLMEKVHEGKRSPMKITAGQLGADKPDWELLAKQLPDFEAMSGALRTAKDKELADLSDSYVGAVKGLVTAVGKRDLEAGRKALDALKKSCVDCHTKDGPGGELDE